MQAYRFQGVPIKIKIEAKNSNKLSMTDSIKVANVTKNSTVLPLVLI